MASHPAFQALLANPDALAALVDSNPALRALSDAHPELRAALRDPATRSQLAAIGVDLGPIMSAEAFATKIATDNQMWEKTFKTAGLMQ